MCGDLLRRPEPGSCRGTGPRAAHAVLGAVAAGGRSRSAGNRHFARRSHRGLRGRGRHRAAALPTRPRRPRSHRDPRHRRGPGAGPFSRRSVGRLSRRQRPLAGEGDRRRSGASAARCPRRAGGRGELARRRRDPVQRLRSAVAGGCRWWRPDPGGATGRRRPAHLSPERAARRRNRAGAGGHRRRCPHRRPGDAGYRRGDDAARSGAGPAVCGLGPRRLHPPGRALGRAV